jgi:hypothetical protein
MYASAGPGSAAVGAVGAGRPGRRSARPDPGRPGGTPPRSHVAALRRPPAGASGWPDLGARPPGPVKRLDELRGGQSTGPAGALSNRPGCARPAGRLLLLFLRSAWPAFGVIRASPRARPTTVPIGLPDRRHDRHRLRRLHSVAGCHKLTRSRTCHSAGSRATAWRNRHPSPTSQSPSWATYGLSGAALGVALLRHVGDVGGRFPAFAQGRRHHQAEHQPGHLCRHRPSSGGYGRAAAAAEGGGGVGGRMRSCVGGGGGGRVRWRRVRRIDSGRPAGYPGLRR